MAFIYERVGEEQVEFANSLGFCDWDNYPRTFNKYDWWYADKENDMYMKRIGGLGDNYGFPEDYTDFYYKGHIVRMDTFVYPKTDQDGKEICVWDVRSIKIPRAIWEERETVIVAIKEAMVAEDPVVYKIGDFCEPQMVEKAYEK